MRAASPLPLFRQTKGFCSPFLQNNHLWHIRKHFENPSGLQIPWQVLPKIQCYFYQSQIHSLPCPVSQSVSQSITSVVKTWLMWPWRVKIHTTPPKVTQPPLAFPAVVSLTAMLLMSEQKKTCCWCRKNTKAMPLTPEWNKSHAEKQKQKPCCWLLS